MMRDIDKSKEELIEELNRVRANEKKYQTILNNLWDGVSVLDDQGNVIEANSTYCQMLGYDKEDIIGQPVLNFIHPDSHHTLDGFQQQLETQGRASLESVDIHKDGTSIPILVRGIPCDVMGQKTVIGVIQDISVRKHSQKKLQDSEAKYLDLYENSPSAFLSVCYQSLNIIRCNKALSKLLGYSHNQLLKMKAQQLFADTENGIHKAKNYIKKTRKGIHIKNCQLQMKHKNGESIWISLSERPITDTQGYAVESRTTIMDISAQKKLEASLIESQKVSDRANQAKSHFLSQMSHELRTPMHSILGFSQLLEREFENTPQGAYVSYILNSGKHLLSLMDDILDLSRIESGKIPLDIKNIELLQVIEKCTNTMKEISLEKNITLFIEEKHNFKRIVRADFTRITQVLLNIISNAIKYNSQGGKVVLKGEEDAENCFRIAVTDDGVGIAKKLQCELFTPFNRLGKENSEIEGTGIGLVICKKLIESMNGNIGFSSTQGKGSQFWINIPLASEQQLSTQTNTQVSPKSSPVFTSKPQTVLYVEDNPIDMQLMKIIMQNNFPNVNLLVASDAKMGMELANTQSPNIIILDIRLPGLNGLELLKQLKKSPKTQNINIIALTAEATQKNIEDGLSAGFYAYLTKPVDLNMVTDTINRASANA